MVKVFVIIGLLLVIAGVPGLYWCSLQSEQQQQQIDICKVKYKHQVDEYFQKLTGSSLKATDANAVDAAMAAPDPEKMKPSERLQYQHERLLADIDELAEASIAIPVNADVLYGDNWRQKVADYKDKKQSRATVRVSSVTAVIAGGVLFVAAIVFAFFRIIAAGIAWVVKRSHKKDVQEIPRQQSRPIVQEHIVPPVVTVVNSPAPAVKTSGPTAEEFRKQLMTQTENLKETVEQLKNLAGVLQQSGAEHDHNLSKRLEKGFKAQHENFKHENDLLKKLAEDLREAVEAQSGSLSKAIEHSTVSLDAAVSGESEKARQIAHAAYNETVRLYGEGFNAIRQQIEELTGAVQASALRQAEPVDISAQLEKSLQLQMEMLKKEIEPLKDKTAAPTNTDAVGKTLADLTEQVGAIREYAARQQQRLAKLQDGYDWNLIKNFCLRVIRCIDNLDDRIGELSANAVNAEHLLTVREELAFILESNGIEPFGAKVDSDYHGQENRVQVLNERDETDDRRLIGRIAQVVRPGYQCRVNDEYTKIVRPAQVRLYGPCLNDVTVRGA